MHFTSTTFLRCLVGVLVLARAEAFAGDALLVDGVKQEIRVSRFVFDGVVREIEMTDAEGQSIACAPEDFIRWGEPSNSRCLMRA